jgi:hypothetical protein
MYSMLEPFDSKCKWIVRYAVLCKFTCSMWIVNPIWLPWKANILHRPLWFRFTLYITLKTTKIYLCKFGLNVLRMVRLLYNILHFVWRRNLRWSLLQENFNFFSRTYKSDWHQCLVPSSNLLLLLHKNNTLINL